ncbi:hypothetical protein MM1S1540310_2913 [Mycobacteroides abscessus subsp. bolletii 1S-154-0310]|uniref:Uncharacterized protein n=2 Tax=Mycobacteroides abscessus TaxID=36809 RepID=A0A829MIC3_9MYCO|nr:hypothetical protein MM1S1510930_3354 [Mycobacteroides abscessus subsp. bolletii 1S-151-0930]EIU68265.1 hypothetical protein MM1S1520914_3560 [Mycobacteroides abscessus subsp. bolletii 1S-152-0914]EIU77658.1 hypothetical protein MM2B0626_3276 [Mycobacteroides abscessus subsp. bolletii 2B-0626]EIU79754.1 hypothetical protein MM1S1540310_2913 [Mycobacteroides abscessus subsp. bolletii 1S-154-0310]EIV03369.1 hypothetical protein MM2B0912R_3595 [Mycobacteroides abscessus subsp. bolletii 2B-0912-
MLAVRRAVLAVRRAVLAVRRAVLAARCADVSPPSSNRQGGERR